MAASTNIPRDTKSANSVILFIDSSSKKPANKVRDKIIGTASETIIASLKPNVKIRSIAIITIEINKFCTSEFTASFAVYPSSLVIVKAISFLIKSSFIKFIYSKILSFIKTEFEPFNFEILIVTWFISS